MNYERELKNMLARTSNRLKQKAINELIAISPHEEAYTEYVALYGYQASIKSLYELYNQYEIEIWEILSKEFEEGKAAYGPSFFVFLKEHYGINSFTQNYLLSAQLAKCAYEYHIHEVYAELICVDCPFG